MTAELRTDLIAKAFGGVQALDGCTLTVPEGSITGLIGPNGSGKTTLFNIVTGYERPDAGQVYLGGRRITGASAQRVFGLGLGRTFQLTRIFPRLTLLENMLVATRRDSRPGRLLARAGRAADLRHAHELLEFTGISRHAGELASALSYGERKLLELATVLAADPAIVLLDEPAGGVNPTLIQHIAARIRDLNGQGTTFLIVEHNMEFVLGLCHQIAVLDYGTVVAAGPPEAISADPRVLDAYLGAALDEPAAGPDQDPEPDPGPGPGGADE
jgi:neutral amino acid transport system ATP-binding protein